MNFDDNSNNRDEILKALREEELVHIEVNIENDKPPRNKSPLGLLADSFEYLVNRLLFDVLINKNNLSGSYISYLQMELDKFIALSSMLTDLPVIDIAGDGSVQMTESALATSVTEKLPVITVIFNNGMLGMVAQWQRLFYERKYIGVELQGIPDYVKIAEAYGAQGIRAQSMNEFEKALKNALNSDVATVIDVPINPDEDVYPFVVPNTALKDMIIA